ncbi:uncharacterized protein METZ01_LOCUS410848, partial [marine metagenome]
MASISVFDSSSSSQLRCANICVWNGFSALSFNEDAIEFLLFSSIANISHALPTIFGGRPANLA